MKRWFRALMLTFVGACIVNAAHAQTPKSVSGTIAPNQVRVFVKDTLYRVSGTLTVAGTLLIEPGTTVEFLPNGRLIDSVGGRIIADGRVSAQYNNIFDPFTTVKNPGPPPVFYTGFADIDYFSNAAVTTAPNINEPTVNVNKANNLFRVNMSSTDARLQNLTAGQALLYKLSRIEFAGQDPNINQIPWQRPGGGNINVAPGRITFRGAKVNDFSREWGHIVVLPGAEAAYFRDVDFVNFRKDVTVDDADTYNAPTSALEDEYEAMNARMRQLKNGAGGALTSFSVRTWLVACNFDNNMARYRGGAVQLLQAPLDNFGPNGNPAIYPDVRNLVNTLPFYPQGTNPNVTDPVTGVEINQQLRQIDNLRNSGTEPMNAAQRQMVDDARLSVYLGRVRELTFRNNMVLLSNFGQKFDGNGNLVGNEDKLGEEADVNGMYDYRNTAWGGALYVAGRNHVEISLGNNNGFAPETDHILFEGNKTINLQGVTPVNNRVTQGSRGGAVYVGDNTSVTFSGMFRENSTELGFNPNIGDYSQGGAIYANANAPRIHIRGGQSLVAGREMHFLDNMSGRGGAIYAFLLTPTNQINLRPSPAVGGSDNTITTRNYGYNVKFLRNTAEYDGGAIYTNKLMSVNGAGGTVGTASNYGGLYRVEFAENTAGFSGGAIAVNIFGNLNSNERNVSIVRALFQDNMVGDVTNKDLVRGGGAIYANAAELSQVRATEFLRNTAMNGNGGAICYVQPLDGGVDNRLFITDYDQIGTGDMLISNDEVFTYRGSVVADARSMTRFLENEATPNMDAMGSGTTQNGDVSRVHPGTNLPENGTGLGGAIYILDNPAVGRNDQFEFNRVRFQDNMAYSGPVVYSDNYDLKVVFQRSLITGNVATSAVGADQNAIVGPYVNGNNEASSDLAGAVLYGEILGPLPFASRHVAANAIYDNSARFLIRLPDAPDTKGNKAGRGEGFGGVDTLRGNYWGPTEADVTTVLEATNTVQPTFFVAGDDQVNHLPFEVNGTGKNQGPFEYNGGYTYTPIPVSDDFNRSIPEALLMQGHIYDIFDKGTDIKTADYSDRRMSRIEDFAVGIPPTLKTFDDATMPSNGKTVKRWARDPFDAETDDVIRQLQTEMKGSHPIGYPLFLEAHADYTTGDNHINNNDDRAFHETTYFVINNNTGDFVRVNLRQTEIEGEVFRGRVEFVPDSSNRNFNPLTRRTQEGLANFGGGAALLQNLSPVFMGGDILSAARNEDDAALAGRKWQNSWVANGTRNLGDANTGDGFFQYGNRPGMPANTGGNDPVNGQTITYFGGEKFGALPVRIGDTIRVVSRTTLWKEGVNTAIAQGMKFGITSSTMPPVFTGSKVEIEENQIPGYEPADGRDVIFIYEDVAYPKTSGRGRDEIFTITATDTNQYHDPRSVTNANAFTDIEYGWSVEAGSGLSYWLDSRTVFNQSRAGALGYVELIGQPTNPYIVPGGEVVKVWARNWPMNSRTVDILKEQGMTDDEIAKYIYLFRPYFSASVYDADNARFLQQDTIDHGFDNTTEYEFRVFVMDSIPVFDGTDFPCQKGDTIVASVVGEDALRLRIDINTDDEAEDKDAADRGWDFRYGRTAYAFQTVGVRPDNDKGDTITDDLSQIRPDWLGNSYLLDEDGNADQFGTALTERGFISVDIPYTEAIELLTPENQVNGAMNTDTIFSIVVSDGHGGVNYQTFPVLVNFSPRITTDALAPAREDEYYNPGLLDSTRAIMAYDPNRDQRLSYRLLYAGDQGETILKDPCYPEAGDWTALVSNADTPEWLKIDSITGRLYGRPGTLDAPRQGADSETVTVMVTDECGLTYVTTLPLEVEMVTHPPILSDVPAIICVDRGDTFTEDFDVFDIDLIRDFPETAREEITITFTKENGDALPGWTATPNPIVGPSDTTQTFTVTGTITTEDPEQIVKMIATDMDGNTDELTFIVQVSAPTFFISNIKVENNQGAYQWLQWGTANNATTGEEDGEIGRLDPEFCEYEIPPIPMADIFDARWTITNRRGILRNVVPAKFDHELKALFQAGGDQSSVNYPITVEWDMSEVPEAGDAGEDLDFFIRDANTKGNRFLVNMRESQPWNRIDPSSITLEVDGTTTKIVIKNQAITGFEIVIMPRPSVSVEEEINGVTVHQNTPNPFNASTTIAYDVDRTADVSVVVYNEAGTAIATLANGLAEVGSHTVTWNGRTDAGTVAPSGVYFYRVTVDGESITRNMILVK